MHRHSSFGDPSPWFTPHHTHKTSKATAAALTPTQLWFGVSELTEGKRRAAHLKNVTKNCTRSMKLLCWEKAIYERGKKKKKGEQSQKSALIREILKGGVSIIHSNMQALD